MSEQYSLWNALPAAVRGQYALVSCLKIRAHEVTCLCSRQEDGSRVLMKITDSPAAGERLRNEDRLLRRIRMSGTPEADLFPAPVFFQSTEEAPPLFFSVRGFIPGHSLESIIESQPDRPGISLKTALDYMDQLLSQLSFLHHQDPPVIHRDIKPQNVIIDEEGCCHLIDLDIAREQKAGRERDTEILGTRLTAPPEQFGYRPTDARSDLYSAGVMLRYCLTGEYGEEADETLDPSVHRIVGKATRFDPEDRFQDARAFQAELRRLNSVNENRKSPRWFASGSLIFLALLLILLALLPRNPGPEYGKAVISEISFAGDEDLYRMFLAGDFSQCSAAITPEGLRFVRYAEYTAEIPWQSAVPRTPLSTDLLDAYLDALEQTGLWKVPFNLIFMDLEIESLQPFRRAWESRHFCLEFHNCLLPEDLTPLSAVAPGLKELYLSERVRIRCAGLTWLEKAPQLEILDLAFETGQKPDLSLISRFSNLRILRLNNIPVSDELLFFRSERWTP